MKLRLVLPLCMAILAFGAWKVWCLNQPLVPEMHLEAHRLEGELRVFTLKMSNPHDEPVPYTRVVPYLSEATELTSALNAIQDAFARAPVPVRQKYADRFTGGSPNLEELDTLWRRNQGEFDGLMKALFPAPRTDLVAPGFNDAGITSPDDHRGSSGGFYAALAPGDSLRFERRYAEADLPRNRPMWFRLECTVTPADPMRELRSFLSLTQPDLDKLVLVRTKTFRLED